MACFSPGDAVPGGENVFCYSLVRHGEPACVCVFLCAIVCLCSLIPFQSAMTCSLACCPFALLTLSLSQSCSVCVFCCIYVCVCVNEHVRALNKHESREKKTPLVVRKKQKASTQRRGRDKCQNKGWIVRVAIKLIKHWMADKRKHTSTAWTSHFETPESHITAVPSFWVDCCFISFILGFFFFFSKVAAK